ncbi:hypothetical protein CLIB1444_04S05336 [[Candida] jaroonii]|uniref:Uncharacterized protein n=1 Tax=[Candida] jaroonii TaxID=467808 RepID=A0ACA9Y6W6_9ASCO|nr:hypothetical protein CLIB1444_04S05336 [[Candida] jaroonii]
MGRTPSATPAPRDKSTWINDYFKPGLDDSPIPDTIKLKGWFKSDLGNKKQFVINDKDVLDLSKMKYYEEVPIVNHSEDKEEKEELNKGLTTKSEDDQISSLSGIA